MQFFACLILLTSNLQAQPDENIRWKTPANKVHPKLAVGAKAGLFVPTDVDFRDTYGNSFTAGLNAAYYFSPHFSLELASDYWGRSQEDSFMEYQITSTLRGWPLTISGKYHYPFRNEHLAWYIGGGTGVVFAKFIGEMTYIDPFTMEHVTQESEEGKTGWDVHAGTGLQYYLC